MTGTDVTLIVCGAPLADRTPDLIAALQADGLRPNVVGTPSSTAWLDSAALTRLTGEKPRLEYRAPSEAKRAGTPTAVIVCPATFNTVNKAAAGVADTYALGALCEALGSGVPTLVAPMVNDKLWGHPAWAGSLRVLRDAGAVLLDVMTGGPDPAPVPSGTGADVTARFEPAWVTTRLKLLLPR